MLAAGTKKPGLTHQQMASRSYPSRLSTGLKRLSLSTSQSKPAYLPSRPVKKTSPRQVTVRGLKQEPAM